MSGSIRSNNSAIANVNGLAYSVYHETGWIKAGATAYTTGPRWQYFGEWGVPGRYYAFQLYTDATLDTLEFYSDETGAIVIASGSPTGWYAYRFLKNGTSVTFQIRALGVGTWTTVTTFTIATANIDHIEHFQTGANDGLCVDAYLRSARGHTTALSEAQAIAENASTTPVITTNHVTSVADGATPSISGTNWNGGTYGSVTFATTGTALYSTDDPISSGGPVSIAAAVAGVGVVASPVLKKRTPFAAAAVVGVGAVAAAPKKRTPLAATVGGVGAVAAALRSAVRLAAAAVGVGTVAANAKASKPLAAAAGGTGTVTANTPAAVKRLGAVANAVGVVAATLGVRRGLAASSTGTATVAATVTTTAGQQLTAVVGGTGAVAASLRTVRRLAATVGGAGSVASALRKRVPLAATATGTGVVDADLTATAGLASSIAGTGSVAAALRVRRGLVAGVVGAATVAATARALRRLAGVVGGAGTVSAALSTDSADPIAAAASGSAIVAAALRVRQRLAAAINGVATFVASLRLYGETVETPYTLRPTAPLYTLRPTAPIYSVRGNMDRYPAFDPQTRDYVEFDLVDFVATRGVPIASATIVQVDGNDAPIGTPTIDLLAATVTGTKARAYVNGVTALVGSLLRLRCSFVFADGRTGNTTGILPIKHT